MNHTRKENTAGADGKVALGRGALSSDAELVQAARQGDKRARMGQSAAGRPQIADGKRRL